METQSKFWSALNSAWMFFDGRKTIIGGILLGLSAYLQGLTEIIQASVDWWQLTINILAYTGGWITTGGAVHKITKTRFNDAHFTVARRNAEEKSLEGLTKEISNEPRTP